MAASVVPSTDNPYNLIVTEPPSFVRPYVIPDLSGPAVVLINDAIRAPINNLSSGGAFSLLQLNAQNYIRSGYGDLYQTPPHYHSRFHETFFCYKGEVTLWANGEARMLTAQDFGSMPTMQNHSYSFTEPDSTLLAFITPGGFEHFYWNVSVPLVDPTDAPFAPDIHTHFLETTFEAAIGPVFDVIPIFNSQFSYNFTNGTTNQSAPWHNGKATVPNNAKEPYYLANNWSQRFLHRATGQVIQPRATAVQSGGNFTLSTMVMRGRAANETTAEYTFDVPQFFQILEGTMMIRMMCQTVSMSTGDIAFIPAGTAFSYWSEVAFTKVYLGCAPAGGLSDALVAQAEPWAYGVFPSYFGNLTNSTSA
ncbi:hypothetical protein LTR48_006951 [Friedmanniomyces endolithicus]|uniref:Cupin 2 conserved barrel domain-containing protein n=1 Tax=Rachicladosporium monterosium TaxID=1507873 RepID=A0ABR0KYM5_9PEZI|nr:hypothetical protein LTR29_005260 [Friedmanniomyces endolithicus]KAK1091116.1 hypothetical protein LTR48_006951 [Friedmanniomyces endolithicus]KAK5140186.1 hypothetical protein LTR32_006942 [Rachicladosporium monterosium]